MEDELLMQNTFGKDGGLFTDWLLFLDMISYDSRRLI